ncbi:hypothetical protein GY45DRAFT_1369638 [Cubamyces sp. BRFM 1775]|nr:hypothetical protein GY45DRAFT_1369638 [Cubamyces sp. BRFM 1775]
MSVQGPWLTHLDSLAQQLEAHKVAQEAHIENRDDKAFYRILREACDIVRNAEADATPELPYVAEKAHALFSNAVGWAYTSDHYGFLASFADAPDAPPVKDVGNGCGADITEIYMEFYTKYLYPGAPRPKLPPFAKVAPWTKAPPPPHPYSTWLSRFREGAVPPLTGATPLARLIYQARAELSIDFIDSPYGMELSSGGTAARLALLRLRRRRRPPRPRLRGHGLGAVERRAVHHITTDEKRELLFLADDDRIKPVSWAPNVKGKAPQRLPNVHTMNSLRDFDGPIVLLPNGCLARVGTGKAAVWAVDALEKHQDSPGKLIGDGELNTDNSRAQYGNLANIPLRHNNKMRDST